MEFNYDSLYRGLFFAILPINLGIAAFSFPIWPKWLDQRVLILGTSFVLSLALLLNGPSIVF